MKKNYYYLLLAFLILIFFLSSFKILKWNKDNNLNEKEMQSIYNITVIDKIENDTTEEEMKSLATDIDNVKTYIEGKEIVKVITIPKKLVSIVIK